MENSDLLQSVGIELLGVRQMANQSDDPLLVYFIDMAIRQTKSKADSSRANSADSAGGERKNRSQNGLAQCD
jgi:hypothetical protein